MISARSASEIQAQLAYVAALHRQLDRSKRYPTGREASLTRPEGSVAVWVDVERDGRVAGRGVVRSSGSALLDWTATGLVGRARYPALPSDLWSDRPTHRFIVSYRFFGASETTNRDRIIALDVR